MAALVSDTHAAIWYLRDDSRLSQAAGAAMDSAIRAGDPIHVPSICLVEATYLVEKGRVPSAALKMLRDALVDPCFGMVPASLDLRIADALQQIGREDVPDLPDRVIAATALALHVPLVTRDRKIRAAAIQTIW